jgi:hypothetical protein
MRRCVVQEVRARLTTCQMVSFIDLYQLFVSRTVKITCNTNRLDYVDVSVWVRRGREIK